MSNKAIVEIYEDISNRAQNSSVFTSGRDLFCVLTNYPKRLARDIAEKMGFNANDRILDLGCNLGIYHPYLAPRVKSILGVDAGRGIIERAQKENRLPNVSYQAFDILGEWPPLNQKFSKVLVYSVIHFFESEQQLSDFLKKISSHLEEGGVVMLGEVRTIEKYEKFRKDLANRKIPTLRDLKFKLNKIINRIYLGEIKGEACTPFRRDVIFKIAEQQGFSVKEFDQQSFHPYYNTCTDFILKKKI